MNSETLKKKVQVVIIAEGDLLLFEFNNQIPNNYVGFQNITGSVENEESYYEAALRELEEEAGVAADVIDTELEFTFHDRWGKNCVEKVYLCHLDKKPEIVLSAEHLNYKWVPAHQVQKTDYRFPTNFEAFLASKKIVAGKEL